jgi:peptide/nickel transport system ATP-binding protein
MCALQLDVLHVSKAFQAGLFNRKPKCILENISFGVQKGQTFGIVGDSGTGKTTLGKIIAAIDKPTRGNVLYKGRSLKDMKKEEFSAFRKKVQMMFQDPEGSLNAVKTIRRSMEEVLSLIKIPRRNWKGSIEESFKTVGLDQEILVRYPREVSGGQNQRVALARILLLDPELIIFDEPTSALDISVQAQILRLLRELQERKGLTYIFISHDMDVIKFMCHRIGVLKNRSLKFPT